MDLEEWEILSDGGFVDHHEEQGGNKMKNSTLIDMDYFENISDQQKENNNLMVIPVPINKFDDQEEEEEEEIPEEVTKLPILESTNDSKDKNFDDQEMISKVFFNKLKENEFVDMKIDVGSYDFVKKGENFEEKNTENDEKLVVYEEKKVKMEEDDDEEEEEHGGVKIWKWAMTGMGALVSFGFAAATVSLIVFSNKHKDGKNSKNQELHFQIYSHDKRFKQVVRRAKRLNEAISVMRGAPMTRAAHITIGGYYEAL